MKIFPRVIIAIGIVITCSFLTQCKKDAAADNVYGLPSATQNGSEIFACLINGTGFIADNDLNDPNYPTSGNGAWLKGDTLTVAGLPQTGSYFQGIQFSLIGNLQEGAIYIADSSVNSNAIAVIGSDSTCQGVSLYPISSFAVNATIELTKFDTVNKIVSGTFNCTFPPFVYNCGDDSLYVTEGRFDYKYH